MWSVRRQGGPRQIFVPLVWAQCASNLHVLPQILSLLLARILLLSRPFAIFNRERTEPPFPRASLPLSSSSLPLISFSLSLLRISYLSFFLRRESNRFGVSAFQRILVLPTSLDSFLPFFLPRERKSAKLDLIPCETTKRFGIRNSALV